MESIGVIIFQKCENGGFCSPDLTAMVKNPNIYFLFNFQRDFYSAFYKFGSSLYLLPENESMVS